MERHPLIKEIIDLLKTTPSALKLLHRAAKSGQVLVGTIDAFGWTEWGVFQTREAMPWDYTARQYFMEQDPTKCVRVGFVILDQPLVFSMDRSDVPSLKFPDCSPALVRAKQFEFRVAKAKQADQLNQLRLTKAEQKRQRRAQRNRRY